jgi:hypothetical protein
MTVQVPNVWMTGLNATPFESKMQAMAYPVDPEFSTQAAANCLAPGFAATEGRVSICEV